ncbi:MAG: DNA replication/repair protein RecF [Flavobacteriales bacterium]
MEQGKNITLQRLLLYNFKNYEEAELVFETERIVCLLGHNGSGKTNLLDAIHYLCFTKSFFNPADSQNITSGHEQGSIAGEFDKDGHHEHIQIALRKSQRKVMKRNFKEYDRLSEHIGLLPAVMLTPYDIALVWEGSEERRRFIDSAISQYSHAYLEHLVQYNHALLQRNNLLKTFSARGGYHPTLLEPWDAHLIHHGSHLHSQRAAFLQSFVLVFKQVYDTISGGKELPDLLYASELNEKNFETLLLESADKDRVLERTTQGIHKDDLDFVLDGRTLKKYASQGQQKSYLIALKLAQLEWMKHNASLAPILLLDDVFDKVDEQRVKQMMHWLIENHSGQVFITDTHPERMPALLNELGAGHDVWQVSDGKVEQQTHLMAKPLRLQH